MLIEKINKYFESQKDRERDRKFHVSEVGNCDRALYFDFLGYEKEEIDAATRMKFHNGNVSHRKIVSILLGCNDINVVGAEVTIPENDLITGRADLVVSLDNQLYVVDIKTIADYGFNLLSSVSDISKNYIYQIQLYMHFLKIPNGIILFENKNTNEMKEFFISYNKDLCEKLIERMKNLKIKIDNKIVPEKPYDLEDWQCNYCRFKKVCYGMNNNIDANNDNNY